MHAVRPRQAGLFVLRSLRLAADRLFCFARLSAAARGGQGLRGIPAKDYGDDAVNRCFTGVLFACIAAAALCLLATMPPLRQAGFAQGNDIPYFSAKEDRIDINTAPAAELRCLPGIGKKKAQAILRYRAQNGPFSSADELAQVEGISLRMAEEFRDLICFSSESSGPISGSNR